MNILHVCADEKFMPFAQGFFHSAFPGRNRFWVSGLLPGQSPKFVDPSYGVTRLAVLDHRLTGAMRADLAWCDLLIVHFMTRLGSLAVRRVGPRATVFWSAWGADYWGYLSRSTPLVLQGTAALIPPPPKVSIQELTLRRLWRSARRRMIDVVHFRNWEQETIRRIDIFSSPIPEDFELLKRALPGLRAKYQQISYGSVETTFEGGANDEGGRDILVGNSATYTNNHVEVFNILKTMDLGTRRVVVPLSYGDPVYREKITKLGEECLGGRFLPLVDFMPLEEYKQTLSQCSTVIMNHVRQQALGTINIMMYRGARIYMRPESTVHSFFRRRGAHVDDVGTIAQQGSAAFRRLSPLEIETNRKILRAYWGHKVVLDNIRALGGAMRSQGYSAT